MDCCAAGSFPETKTPDTNVFCTPDVHLTQNFDKAISHGQRACELEPSDPFNFTALSVTFQRAWAGTQEQKYIQMAEDAMAESKRLEMMK